MNDVLDASLRARAVSAIKRRNGDGSFAVVDHVEIMTTSLQEDRVWLFRKRGFKAPYSRMDGLSQVPRTTSRRHMALS